MDTSERLKGIKAKSKYTNKGYFGGYMSFNDTNWLIKQAERTEKATAENECYREAIKMAMDYVQDGRNPRANKLYQYFQHVLEGEK